MGDKQIPVYYKPRYFKAQRSLCELRSIDNLCFSKLTSDTMADVNELACTYAALILTDDEVHITGEKIASILKAANVDVEPIWPSLFAKALTGIDVRSLISNVGSSVGAAPSAGAAAAPAGGAAAVAAAPAEEKKEEKRRRSRKTVRTTTWASVSLTSIC